MEFAASSGSMLSLKSSCENGELGCHLGNKVGYILLDLPGTAQRFSRAPGMFNSLEVQVLYPT